MHFTEEQYSNINNNLEGIEKIVRNSSGTLSPQLIKIIEEYGKIFFPSFCAKCSTGRFNIVTRLYRFYLEDKMEKQKQQEEVAKTETVINKETEVNNGKSKKRKSKNA